MKTGSFKLLNQPDHFMSVLSGCFLLFKCTIMSCQYFEIWERQVDRRNNLNKDKPLFIHLPCYMIASKNFKSAMRKCDTLDYKFYSKEEL